MAHRHVRKSAQNGQHTKHKNPNKQNDNSAPSHRNHSTAMYIENRPERRTCAKVLSCCRCFLARVPAALLFASKNLVASLSTAATQLRNWKTRRQTRKETGHGYKTHRQVNKRQRGT